MPKRKAPANIHSGHRQRLRKTALNVGVDNLSDIQTLELMLFYAIPRRDTNELSHRLINRFGFYDAVLNADYHSLLEVDGIGENAASLIAFMTGFFRKYEQETASQNCYLLDNEHRQKYVRSLFIGKTREEFYLVCLNSQCRLLRTQLLAKGSLDDIFVFPRRVLEEALLRETKYVILAHNHPGGKLNPSAKDFDITYELINTLDRASIIVIDHLIVAGNQCFSFLENGLIEKSSKS